MSRSPTLGARYTRGPRPRWLSPRWFRSRGTDLVDGTRSGRNDSTTYCRTGRLHRLEATLRLLRQPLVPDSFAPSVVGARGYFTQNDFLAIRASRTWLNGYILTNGSHLASERRGQTPHSPHICQPGSMSNSESPRTDRIALVTGANQGVGLQVARVLVANGLTVLVGSRNFERGERGCTGDWSGRHPPSDRRDGSGFDHRCSGACTRGVWPPRSAGQ